MPTLDLDRNLAENFFKESETVAFHVKPDSQINIY